MSLNQKSEYLTPQEAAAKLRVCKRTILRAVERGDLAAVHFGQTIRIPADARIEKTKEIKDESRKRHS
jgi:excisionase family DNA binding protein